MTATIAALMIQISMLKWKGLTRPFYVVRMNLTSWRSKEKTEKFCQKDSDLFQGKNG